LGLVFSYLVILTDSLYAGIIGHITNNGFAVTLGYIINRIADSALETQEVVESMEVSTTIALLVNLAVFIGISIFTISIAFRLIKIIKRDMKNQKNIMYKNNFDEEGTEYEKIQRNKVSFLDFLPLLFVLPLFLWIGIIQIKEIIYLG